jgi:ferredoxin
MPKIIVHKNGQVHQGEVRENSNLVVRAGIKQFPYPYLSYGCGMGKCAKCTSRIINGAEHLPAPNWKEKKLLAERLELGYRLICQLWIGHDLELTQDDLLPARQVSAPELPPCT